MRREIKFRVWDKQNKRMIHRSDIQTEPYCLVVTLEGKLIDIAYERMDLLESWDDLADFYEVMQFTGLKDKSGKEIYEGDYLRMFYDGEPADAAFLVLITFKNGAFGYGESCFVSFEENPEFQWKDGQSKHVTVIGNIHETPELLK